MNPAMIISLLLMAAGTYTTYKTNKDAKNRANKAALDAQLRQSQLNDAAQGKTVEFADKVYDPETRKENTAQAADTATKSIMQEIIGSRDRGMGETSQASGKITGDYSKGRGKMIANTLRRASILASLTGKARGSTDLRFTEGIKRAGLGGEMADLQSLMSSRANSDQNIIGIEGRPSPGGLALGSLMSGVGTAGVMSGVSGTTAPATNAASTMPATFGTNTGGAAAFRYPTSNGVNAMNLKFPQRVII